MGFDWAILTAFEFNFSHINLLTASKTANESSGFDGILRSVRILFKPSLNSELES